MGRQWVLSVVALIFWIDYGDSVKQTVDVKVFYETHCPHSAYFISKQLYPTYQMYPSIISLHMYPYGRAKMIRNENRTIEFICEHGDGECLGNIISSCAIRIWNDPLIYLPFLSCMEEYEWPERVGSKCARRFNYSYGEIRECTETRQGYWYERDMAEATEAIVPSPTFVPWILFNNIFNENLVCKALTDFQGIILNISNRSIIVSGKYAITPKAAGSMVRPQRLNFDS